MAKKRVKTFQDKQRKLTKAEEEALNHMRTKGSGKQVKNEIITPDQVKLQDVVLGGKDLEVQEGKIITEETLQREKEQEKKELERYNEEFRSQVSNWKNEDHAFEYEAHGLEFDDAAYLVRIFSMDVSSFEKFRTYKYEWSRMMNNFKIAPTQVMDNVYPIVKILKIGEKVQSDKYNVGDIVLVPSTDVIGDEWNPTFLEYMKHQNSQGMKPVLPEGMRQRLNKVELSWGKYQFVRPWVGLPEEADQLTFLIPEFKVIGNFTLNES